MVCQVSLGLDSTLNVGFSTRKKFRYESVNYGTSTAFAYHAIDRAVQTEIALDTSRRYRFIEIRCSINFRAKSARRKAPPEQKFVDKEVCTFIDNWNSKKLVSPVQD